MVIILFLNGSLLAENAISLPSPADSVQIKNSAFAGPVTPLSERRFSMEGLFFAIGFLLGGVFGVLVMCLLQINRLGRKEDSEE